MNQITARLNHPDAGDLYKDCFCYDDAEQGLIAEPLVHQTTAVIHKLFGGQAPEVITLTFSSEGDPQWKQEEHPIAFLHHPTPDTDGTSGTTYICDPVHPEALEEAWMDALGEPVWTVWLCEHLFDFFPSRPDSFFCQLRPSGPKPA
jgi:hypothetical protein